MSYNRSELKNWVSGLMEKYGSYVNGGKAMYLMSMADNKQISDSALDQMAAEFGSSIISNYEMQKEKKPKPHHMTIVPEMDHEGNIKFFDRESGTIVGSLFKQQNGLYSYSGSIEPDALSMMFGRGGLGGQGGAWDQLSDGNFFNYSSKRGFGYKH